jgi:hypothetical protein
LLFFQRLCDIIEINQIKLVLTIRVKVASSA